MPPQIFPEKKIFLISTIAVSIVSTLLVHETALYQIRDYTDDISFTSDVLLTAKYSFISSSKDLGLWLGPNLLIGTPFLSHKNFVKFHLIDDPSKPAWDLRDIFKN